VGGWDLREGRVGEGAGASSGRHRWTVDGRKVVVAVTPGHRESIESWSEVLRDLRDRGMNPPELVVGDGNLGIWGALRNVWPEAR